jgi:acetyltransferase-like isoleucine patch superfamily enzyme
MKNIIFLIVSSLNIVYLKISLRHLLVVNTSKFLFVKISEALKGKNIIKINASNLEKSIFYINGKNNEIDINGVVITNSKISITGSNNKLIISKNAKIREVIIHIRGNNCVIEIGENTTFGGARIVNVGIDNSITIGKNCLFSDHIEIWASDTHSIFNEENVMINHEKPIVIKDSVWVGSRVIILKGVTIGNGSVIGMGSMVTKDIEANTINVGSPAKKVKENIHWKLDYKDIL